ncbi:MAG: arsenosugar biosynthesis radical SAM protein ArsS [Planctomycetes bacterium]|nr:arsenosugar biosynthesis radical SAM protein ArsS [Planctomycetota bacterium]
MTLTLLRQASPLANAGTQRDLLESGTEFPRFDELLSSRGRSPLRADGIRVLQLNLGKLCNQTCRHCHVDAGPDRREIMTRQTVEQCLEILKQTDIPTLDLTGGAPEMNPEFRWLVAQARSLQRHVIDRCNLTILSANGYEDLPEFLASHAVEIVASLPCYLPENTDRQRGAGVYQKSIAALQRLNQLGYGIPGTGLILTLVFNPGGASLPPAQESLEEAYRRELRSRHGIEFTRLFTITNMPISRFLDDLLQSGQFEPYLQKLIDAFNPLAVDAVMCRTTLSVDWTGRLYDCDFNQMLELPVSTEVPQHVSDFDGSQLGRRIIATGRHCFGCTAGAGSSCQGRTVP